MTIGSKGSLEAAAMALLEDALELPSDEQTAFVEGRDDLPDNVRALALKLLRSEQDESVSLRTGGAGDVLAEDDIEPPELPGYQVIRPLGRGGMGAVFLAERSSGDFEHQVAIKVIKPGVLIDTLVDRFRRERQILASLNHPNIAHLYDGGETQDGQPYIVMEYIQGRTMRDWMAEERPDLDRKLAMFQQAAHAVEFAHQNLVIHRDLTPNNVLVTDSEQAKLIDFGIARPQVDETEQSQPSRISGLSLTPGFAAPERASGIGSTTLTDIYSLGRILSLMTERSGEAELDAIAARASTEEPAERFGSVSEMIEEIENFRRKLPITTFSDTSRYRVSKFISREKPLVAAVAGILLAVLAGLIGTGIAYQRAEESRTLAEQRFDGLRDLAKFQLFDLYDEMDHVVGNTQARLALAERSQAYLLGLSENRSGDVDLQFEAAEGFLRLARIQGIPAHPNFGEPALAEENLQRAQEIFERLAEQGHSRAYTGMSLLEAYRALLEAHHYGSPTDALATIRRGEASLEQVPATGRDWQWMLARRKLRISALEWADLQLDSEMIAEYADLLENERAEWPQDQRGAYEERFDEARGSYYRAIVQHNQDTPESLAEALRLYLEADRLYAVQEEVYPNDPILLYWRGWNAYYGYAAASDLLDDPMATQLLSQARDSVDRLTLIEEADNSLNTFSDRLREAQAEYYSNLGRFTESIALMQSVVDVRQGKVDRERTGNSVGELAYGRAVFGSIYRKAGMREEACRNWRLADELMEETEAADALNGFVREMWVGVQANLVLCDAGDPVTAFQPLT